MPLSDTDAQSFKTTIDALTARLNSVVFGQADAVTHTVTALLANGHVILEGVPGVGKTLLARALAHATALQFGRVQFTPDMMPSDLLGTRVFNDATRAFELHKGPVFTEVLLADEVNRTPPKTQSALLEAMEERQVTIDGEHRALSPDFFVIATENPVEFEGTYPLPEAQTDRFLMQIDMGYPDVESEIALYRAGDRRPFDEDLASSPVVDAATLRAIRDAVHQVRADDAVLHYVHAIIDGTRRARTLRLGASPRAGLLLLKAARALALQRGRAHVTPDDVKDIAKPTLRHRLSPSTEAELDGLQVNTIIDDILRNTPVRATSMTGASSAPTESESTS